MGVDSDNQRTEVGLAAPPAPLPAPSAMRLPARVVPHAQQPRRRLLWLVRGLAALVIVSTAVVVLLPPMAARIVRDRALPRLEERLGLSLHIDDLRLGLGKATVLGLVVDRPLVAGAPARPVALPAGKGQRPRPSPAEAAAALALLRAPRVEVELRLRSLLLGRLEIAEVLIHEPSLVLLRDSRHDDVRALLRRLRPPARQPTAVKAEAAPESLLLVASGGRLRYVDELAGVVASAEQFDARVQPAGRSQATISGVDVKLAAGPGAGARRVEASFDLAPGQRERLPRLDIVGGRVALLSSLTLTGIDGQLGPDDGPHHGPGRGKEAARAHLDLHGGYGGAPGTLWRATGWIQPAARKAEVRLLAERFHLSRLAPILEKTPLINPEQTAIDAEALLEVDGTRLTFAGGLQVSGLALRHPGLAAQPITDLGGQLQARGWFDWGERGLSLEEAVIRYRQLSLRLSADAERLDEQPRLRVRLQVPRLPCQQVLEAIPQPLAPVLQGIKLAGNFGLDLYADVDYADLEALVLDGEVGIRECRVTQIPRQIAADRLQQDFEQVVEPEPGKELTFVVGPENEDFVPYEEISPHLVAAILTTEDAGFFQHRGFIPRQFRTALRTNLERGNFRLGASTVTMQMVKNVLLSKEKTLSRKLQELFLTWYLEQHLSKQRILEIYFNVIEFGPGIYGIGRAARHYFGKSASEITALEAAFFSSILPSPKRRYTLYCKGALSPQWARYLQRIVTRMHERGRLDDEEYQQALAQQLVFDRQEAIPEGQCLELVKRVTARVEEEAVGPEENGNGAAAPAQAGEDRRPATKSAGGRGLQHRTAKGQRRKVR